MKRPLIEETTTVVDNETGEVLGEKVLKRRIVKDSLEPDFVKLYIRDIINLANIDLKTTRVDILYMLLTYMDYHNEILINKQRKSDICESCSIKVDYLNKILQDFLQCQILFRRYDKQGEMIRGMFIANPHFFGRGKWEDIYNLQLTIKYDEKTKRYVQLERNPDPQLDIPFEEEK